MCSSSGGAQEKRKTGWKSENHQKVMVFWDSNPQLHAKGLFSDYVLHFTLSMTRLRLLVPLLSDYGLISIIYILVGTRDLRAQWSRFVAIFTEFVLGDRQKKTKQDFMKFLFSRLAFSQFSPSYDFLFFSFLFLFSKDFFFVSLFSSSSFLEQIQAKNPK